MGNNLLQVLQEQQKIIEQQSRLIVDLTATLENWGKRSRVRRRRTERAGIKFAKAERQDLWK